MDGIHSDFDKAIWSNVGVMGRYHIHVCACRFLTAFLIAMSFSLNTLNLTEPQWSCDAYDASIFAKNCSEFYDCKISDGTIEWSYAFRSELVDFELVCDKSFIPNLQVAVPFISEIIGCLLFGRLSDLFGRKTVWMTAMCALVVANALTAITWSWQAYLLARLCTLFFFGGMKTASNIWLMEQTASSHNIYINMLEVWNVDYIFIAIIAYFTGDWRSFVWVMVGVCAFCLLLCSLTVKESPRWLIRKGKVDRASRVLSQIATQNRKQDFHLTAENLQPLRQSAGDDTNKYNFSCLFHPSRRALHTALLAFCCVCASASSDIVVLDMGNQQAGSVYMNFLLLGILRLAVIPITFFIEIRRFRLGRRALFAAAYGSVALCYFGMVLSFYVLPADSKARVVFPLLAATCNGLMWIAVRQLGFELYPTLMRNTADAFFGASDSIGSLLSPLVVYLKNFHPAMPAEFGLASLVISLTLGLAIFPETKQFDDDLLQPLLGDEQNDDDTLE